MPLAMTSRKLFFRSLAKIGLNSKVDGNQLEDRPNQRLVDTLDNDLKTSRLHPFDREKGERGKS